MYAFCPECGARYRYAADMAGQTIACPQCNAQVLVPAEPSAGETIVPLAPPEPSASAGTASREQPLPSPTEGVREAPAVRPSGGTAGLAIDLVRSLAVPARPFSNVVAFGVAVLAMVFIRVVSVVPIWGWLICALVLGYYLAFLFRTLTAAAGGEDDLPGLAPEEGFFHDVVLSYLKYGGVKALAFVPLVLTVTYLTLLGQIGWQSGLEAASAVFVSGPKALASVQGTCGVAVTVALAVGGAFAFFPQPILFVFAGLGGLGGLPRIDLMLATVVDTFPAYCLVAFVFLGCGAIDVWAADAFSGGTPGRILLTALVSVYCHVLAMRSAGLYYHHLKHRFAATWG